VGESAPPVRVLYQPHSEEKKETEGNVKKNAGVAVVLSGGAGEK